MRWFEKIRVLAVLLPFSLLCLAAILFGLSPAPRQDGAVSPRGPTVTDMTDRTVTLPEPANRVFILTPILWHYLSVTMTDEPIVKIPPYMVHEFRASVLGRLFPGLEQKDLAFTDFSGPALISVEELLWTKPDAALIWDYMSRGPDEVNLQSLLKVRADGGDKTKLFNMLGQMTGLEERVARIWERHHELRGRVVADSGECLEPVSAAVIGTSGFTLWGPPSQRHFTDNLQAVCGRNVAAGFASANGTLNIENLLALDPEVIWLNPYVLEQTDLRVESIYEDPRLEGLKAVRNRRVYHMPLGASRLEGPVEVPLSILWQSLILRPSRPTALDMREEIQKTYLDVYGYKLSEAEVDNWLRMEENSNSVEYLKLFGKRER